MDKNATIPYQDIIASQNFFFGHMSTAVFEEEGIFASSMGIENAFFNAVFSTDSDEKTLELYIPKIIQFFEQQSVPWTWVTTPFSKPDNLDKKLEAHGFTCMDSFLVMGTDSLLSLPETSIPDTMQFHEVTNKRELCDWIIPLQAGFQSTKEIADQYRIRTEQTPFGPHKPFHHYILYKDKEPIAGGTFSICNKAARLDSIAVLPSMQGKGIGTMITILILHEIRKQGIGTCFLDSSKDGVKLYKSLGFQEYYTGKCYCPEAK